jgi:hypothetical protein
MHSPAGRTHRMRHMPKGELSKRTDDIAAEMVSVDNLSLAGAASAAGLMQSNMPMPAISGRIACKTLTTTPTPRAEIGSTSSIAFCWRRYSA